jgi:50S ribosomal subunit-associated GTPase HflX
MGHEQVLKELEADELPTITLWNKVDAAAGECAGGRPLPPAPILLHSVEP